MGELYNIINIDMCDLINKNGTIDPIYTFCKKFNIKTFAEFIEIFNEKLYKNELNHYNLDYFRGMIDLINLYYFNKPLLNNDVFDKKIRIKKNLYTNCRYGCIDDTFINSKKVSLRRLGLTNNEATVLLHFVVSYGKEMSVIDSIELYLKDNLSVVITNIKEQEIFMKKLYILRNYFNKNKNEFKSINVDKLNKLEELYIKYNKLNDKKRSIENEIANVSKEMDEIYKSLSSDEFDALTEKICQKKLVK